MLYIITYTISTSLVYLYALYAKRTYMAFTCVNPFCFYSLLLFWLFFLPFGINFKFNAALNLIHKSFHLVAKFHLVSFVSMKKAFYNWSLKCKKYGRALSRPWFGTPRCLADFFQTEERTHLQYFKYFLFQSKKYYLLVIFEHQFIFFSLRIYGFN